MPDTYSLVGKHFFKCLELLISNDTFLIEIKNYNHYWLCENWVQCNNFTVFHILGEYTGSFHKQSV